MSFFPRVDDHLVVPLTRDEIIGGRRVVTSPALPPHAIQHTELNFVLRAYVAPGYRAASDLLTRFDEESDFACDSCLYKDGVDPETGTRYLEELAFLVVSEKSQEYVDEKAWRMNRRGVKRIFAIWVEGQRVICEWDPESQSWRPLDAGSQIEEPCLMAPLNVNALMDPVIANKVVLEVLHIKRYLRQAALPSSADEVTSEG